MEEAIKTAGDNATPIRYNRTPKLILFDFDGTITRKDTLIEFVHFYHGRNRFLREMLILAPVMVLFVMRILPNWKAKQVFLSRFFKGENVAYFDGQCSRFSTDILPTLIRPEAENAIRFYQGEGDTIAVVTASAENWVKPWCDRYGLICLATQLETRDGKLTGKIKGRNCYGDEKVCRIEEQFKLKDFDEIIAYGDSRGDKEMLALAHKRHYKPFRVGKETGT